MLISGTRFARLAVSPQPSTLRLCFVHRMLSLVGHPREALCHRCSHIMLASSDPHLLALMPDEMDHPDILDMVNILSEPTLA